MRTRLVSHKEWRSFFRDFSRVHNGAMVTISVAPPGDGPHDEIVNQSLRGISEDRDEIFVHTGNGADRPHLARRVRNADCVLLQQTDEGADSEVDIDSIDGSRTIVRFRSPALPELLDPGVE
jgi:hypothetical protein